MVVSPSRDDARFGVGQRAICNARVWLAVVGRLNIGPPQVVGLVSTYWLPTGRYCRCLRLVLP
jgi:hypothetical protein